MIKPPYNYMEGGYEYAALHRKVLTFDPRNTLNPIIQEYFNTISDISIQNNKLIYKKLVENELDKYENKVQPNIPISYKMIYQEISMLWISIIHQMLFIEKAPGTFYGEYKDIIDNIIYYDSIDLKESMVYRYYYTGESIFHTAGKVWLYEMYLNNTKNKQINKNEQIDEELIYVIDCYEKLESIMNKKHSILFMCDFFNNTLTDYLTNFVYNLKNESNN